MAANIVPYACLHIDASWYDVLAAVSMTMSLGHDNREDVKRKLQDTFQNIKNRNTVIPCLSVRSAFDLYLQVKKYPIGSEVIMTAVNIPSMSEIVKHHGLNVVPWDISINTLLPNLDSFKQMVSNKTVGVLVSHIYGKYSNIDDLISVAKQHNLDVIEDCAESFHGLEELGNAQADIAMFSFGIIKHATAFGGSLVKVHDPQIAERMTSLHETYPVQNRSQYLRKVLKYAFLMTLVNSPFVTKYVTMVARELNINYKDLFVQYLRTFPGDLIKSIRQQPSTPLMWMIYRRLKNVDPDSFKEGMRRYEYVANKIPSEMLVGRDNDSKNYWLFPVLVNNPTKFIKLLSSLGVDAYSGATQLSIVVATNQTEAPYPHEACSMLERVVYLPVHKHVPFHHLDNICCALETAMKMLDASEEEYDGKNPKMQKKFRSKL
ncbi:uncharacterized protein [Antedon mediterranea]|uniref:uncharacterized protein n=1 Tax=Antedon mediterranea TaxID=105859 RepID=UPI003AF67C22